MFRTIIKRAIAATAIVSFASLAQGQVSFRSLDLTLGKAPQGLASADFNNDGLVDLAVAIASPPSVHVLLNDARDGYRTISRIPLDAFTVGKLSVGDFNGDGLADLIVILPHTQQAAVFTNLGRGEFLQTGGFRTGRDPHGLALADIDGNGSLDAVVANITDDSVTIAFNRGDRFMTESMRVGAGPMHVALANLDADRAPELIVTNFDGRDVMIFNNRGGGFTLQQTLNLGRLCPDALLIRDFDKDGQLDLMVAASGDTRMQSSVWIWTNTRGGFDRPRTIQSRTFTAVGLASADFNNDGLDDLVVSDRDGDSISIMFANRDGSFRVYLQQPVGFGPDELLAQDLDGDGDIDLVVMNTEGYGLTILYNQMRF